MIELLDPHGIRDRIAGGEVKVLRQSTTKTADVCMKRIAFEKDPTVPHGQSVPRAMGTAYHAGIEALYLGDAGYRDAAIAALADEYVRFPHLAEEMAWTDATSTLMTMLHAYVPWPSADFEVLGTEVEWFLPLTERWITGGDQDWVIKGQIDLVLRSRSTGAVILDDQKTAARAWPIHKGDPRKDPQGPLYTWAWWVLTGERPQEWLFSIMTYKGNFERRPYEITDEHISLALGKAVDLAVLLDRVPPVNLPANPSSNLCSPKYCDYWDLCPFGGGLVSAA